MSLSSGKRIHCYKWEILLVGKDVINRVHALALEEGQTQIDTNFKYEQTTDSEVFDEEENEEEIEDIDELLHGDGITQSTILHVDRDDKIEDIEYEDNRIDIEDGQSLIEEDAGVAVPEDEVEVVLP